MLWKKFSFCAPDRFEFPFRSNARYKFMVCAYVAFSLHVYAVNSHVGSLSILVLIYGKKGVVVALGIDQHFFFSFRRSMNAVLWMHIRRKHWRIEKQKFFSDGRKLRLQKPINDIVKLGENGVMKEEKCVTRIGFSCNCAWIRDNDLCLREMKSVGPLHIWHSLMAGRMHCNNVWFSSAKLSAFRPVIKRKLTEKPFDSL